MCCFVEMMRRVQDIQKVDSPVSMLVKTSNRSVDAAPTDAAPVRTSDCFRLVEA